LLLGPFPTIEIAQENGSQAKRLAHNADHRAAWYAYGIASSSEPKPTVFGLGEEPYQQPEPEPVKKTRRRKAVASK
jgi:hypothetical protein